MTWPTISNGTIRPNVVIPRLGVINVPMSVCPFQPSNDSVHGFPRFFGNDAVGNYYGLNGYYGSIPCWLPFGGYFTPYQASTFYVYPGGLHNADALLTNPFQLQAKLTNTNGISGGELAFPYTYNLALGSQQAQTVSMGPNALYLGQIAERGQTGGSNTSVIPWPQQIFRNVTAPFPKVFQPNFSDTTEKWCLSPLNTTFASTGGAKASQLVYDHFTRKLIQMYQTVASYAPCGASRTVFNFGMTAGGIYLGDFASVPVSGGQPGTPNPGVNSSPDPSNPSGPWAEPQVIYQASSTLLQPSAVLLPGTGVTATQGLTKMHPYTGAYMSTGNSISGGLFCGYAFSSYIPGVNAAIDTADVFQITLGVAADNTALYTATGQGRLQIQQIPGGGFLCWNTNNPTNTIQMYLIAADFSAYYLLNVMNLPPTNSIPAQMGVDTSGFVYFLAYSGQPVAGTFQNMYWSGTALPPLQIPTPQLTQLGVACNTFTLEPWTD